MENGVKPIVLVTGGCGYIGSKLVPALISEGWHVRVVDCLYFGNNLPEPMQVSDALDLRIGDISDDRLVQGALDGAEAVIHLAAMANDPSAELDTGLTKRVNLDAAMSLLQLAQAAGVRRYVNASTATVYGVRDEPDVDETFEHQPITLYGEYKSLTDQAVAAANGMNFVATNLRAATVCGYSPRMRLDLTVNILTEQAKNRGKITVHGGAQKRPNIVIDDLVRAYLQLLTVPGDLVGGESFNISASNRSVMQIAEAIVDTVNPAAKIDVEPIMDHRSYHISTAKARERLGFVPELDVEDGARQVAGSIDAGLIANPRDSRYRNVETRKAMAKTAE